MPEEPGGRALETAAFVAEPDEGGEDEDSGLSVVHSDGADEAFDMDADTWNATDGAIEAIAHRTFPWQGWMWHPEREPTVNAQDLERARTLLHTVQGTSRSRRASA